MRRTLCSCCVVVLLPLTASSQGLVAGATLPFTPRGVGDVDGDGVDDYSNVTGSSAVVHSGATGAVIPHLTFAPTAGGYWHAGDVDADGHDDVVRITGTSAASVATVVSGANGAVIHSWNGPAVGSSFTGTSPGADIDGDGCSDILLVAYNALEVRSGRTGTLLGTVGLVTLDPNNPSEITIGDWNGDGATDLAVTAPAIGSVTFRLGPDFAQVVVQGGLFGAQPVRVLGDLAGNGISAIASQTTNPGQVTLLDGINGPVIALFPLATLRHFGDADGDGRDDFVVRSPTFNPALDGLTSGRTLARLPTTLGALNVASPAHGDFDGDGRQDSVTSVAGQAALTRFVDPAVPLASRIVRRGASGATTTGRRPRLHARGHCSVGSTLHVDARGLLPNGLSLLSFGDAANVDLAPLGAPGNRVYTSLADVSVLPTNAHGMATRALPIPASTTLLGATVSLQAAAWEPAANTLGLVTSNALDLAVNN